MPNIAQKAVRVRAGNGDIYNAKAVFVQCTWITTDGLAASLPLNPQQNAGISIDHIESVFVDNSACNVAVTITSANPPQTITIAAGAVVNVHMDVSGLDNPLMLRVVSLPNPFCVTYFIFRDYPVGASSTLLTGAVSATTVTETDLAAAAQPDPADNHAAIRVHDLGGSNVLSAISSALAGTLKVSDTALDALISGGRLPVSDTATTQLAALIASGRLAVSDVALDAIIAGGRLAVSDVALDAIIAGGKLAVADALLEAALRGTGATSRLAAQLTDGSANPFGVVGNLLQVNAGNSALYNTGQGFFSTASGAYNGSIFPGPCFLCAMEAANTTTAFATINVYDAPYTANVVPSAGYLRMSLLLPSTTGKSTMVFPCPVSFSNGIVCVSQAGPSPASATVATAGIYAAATYHT